MKKRSRLILFLLLLVLLSGCSAPDALTAAPWQRVEYLPTDTAEDFLRALDFTGTEIAKADLSTLGIVRTAAFTAQGDYRFGCDAEATKALARDYLDSFLSELCSDPAGLSELYHETYGADMAAMTAEECQSFYAGLFGCADYEALVHHLADALFDYQALAAWSESGRYDCRGKRLFLSDSQGSDLGYVEFSLSDAALTLRYGDTTQTYTG